MNKFKIGIIGASGFIGTHLKQILEANLKVEEIHLFSRSNKHKIVNNSFYHQFDIKNPSQSFPKILKQLDVIYLLQSESTPHSTWEETIEEIKKNCIPIFNFIKFIEN
jgi:N-acetyl-gamma-glutamylphosphate reductase